MQPHIMTKRSKQTAQSRKRLSVSARHNNEFTSPQARELRASLRHHAAVSATKQPLAVHRVAVGNVARSTAIPFHRAPLSKSTSTSKASPKKTTKKQPVVAATKNVKRTVPKQRIVTTTTTTETEERVVPTQVKTKAARKPVQKAKPVAKPAPKPVAKPTVKPAAKPVAKRSVKPATRTVMKPVTKTVPKPVVKSAPAHQTVTKHVKDGCVKIKKGQSQNGLVVDKFAMKKKLAAGQAPRSLSLKVTKHDSMSPSVRRLVDRADHELGSNSDHENDVYLIRQYAEETSEGTSEGTSSMSDYDSYESNTDILSRIRRLFN